MNKKILVFDSHPVQYRAPLWRAINEIIPGRIHVIYASDCSIKGHNDIGFGQSFAWDDPMLTGYNYTILHNENGIPLSGWNTLTGDGVNRIIKKHQPSAILLTGLNYRFDISAFFSALSKGIPVWLRCETQDEALSRSKLKTTVRDILYKVIYKGISKAFYIGELNKTHYLSHGVHPSKLRSALYGTVDRFKDLATSTKSELRLTARSNAGITDDQLVVGFSGKFIEKKDPFLLYDMLEHLHASLLKRIHFYYIGSGPLEGDLKVRAKKIEKDLGVKTHFTGFINQSQLAAHYLAIDTFVLPSRKMGETWGLVVNEALQAGCSVIVSDAVGSSENFKNFPRFRVFKEQDATQLAKCLESLSTLDREFNWATDLIKPYSLESSAQSIINVLEYEE